ncbi:Flavonoid glucosyltransferase, family GT1 [Zostera marina]|uniref:Flavonoid glucosyltransferase, family GT1 n=1 Tax=Zostera marina TaxID=29655 RepID=A0A0K9PH91_ZOSMR|nr:Flavonoid glucosyltransferase, family GT1 [Zostera marina]
MGEETNRTDKIVLYPSPGMGHLLPMVELAKVLIARNRLLEVTILVLRSPFSTGTTETLISSVMAANPLISFHFLPSLDLTDFLTSSFSHHESIQLELIRLSDPNVQLFMSSLHPMAFVVDFFCADSADIANGLGIPTYIFFTCCAATLAVLLYLPTMHSHTNQSFKDMGSTLVRFPEKTGIPAIPADHMPLPLLDREDHGYKTFIHLYERMAEVDGMIINTFDSLEGKTIQSLGTSGAFTRPIYPIGPLIISDRGQTQGESDFYCFKWLDKQPKGSVVFLCFGSLGTFSTEQLKEIADGIERSQERFLWVVKNPPNPSKKYVTNDPPNPDLDFLLPKGFLDRTQDRGLVVKSWAPQVKVLQHEAVGCFVTHLGWNSVLEAICAGVGMIGWPVYAEQRMNRVFVVDDMKLAMAVEGYDKDLVTAAAVEKSVREMMNKTGESGMGVGVKERCLAMKQAVEACLGDGGTSTLALDKLLRDWKVGKES